MGELLRHLLLFAVISAAIVLLGTFHAEAEDRRAFAALPRRALTFVVGCGILALLVVLL
jgi:hypothetical protein